VGVVMATNVFRGSSGWGVPVASLSGRQVFKGPSTNGVPIATIDGPDIALAAVAAAAYLLL